MLLFMLLEVGFNWKGGGLRNNNDACAHHWDLATTGLTVGHYRIDT